MIDLVFGFVMAGVFLLLYNSLGTVVYSLAAGLGEMLMLGVLYGLTLKPAA